jgi:hypothetical protein
LVVGATSRPPSGLPIRAFSRTFPPRNTIVSRQGTHKSGPIPPGVPGVPGPPAPIFLGVSPDTIVGKREPVLLTPRELDRTGRGSNNDSVSRNPMRICTVLPAHRSSRVANRSFDRQDEANRNPTGCSCSVSLGTRCVFCTVLPAHRSIWLPTRSFDRQDEANRRSNGCSRSQDRFARITFDGGNSVSWESGIS